MGGHRLPLHGVGQLAASSTLPVALQVHSRDEVLEAVGAAGRSLTTVRLLMIDHVAKLGRLDVAEHALEELVSPSGGLVDYVLLHEAHVARVVAVSVAHAFFDDAGP